MLGTRLANDLDGPTGKPSDSPRLCSTMSSPTSNSHPSASAGPADSAGPRSETLQAPAPVQTRGTPDARLLAPSGSVSEQGTDSVSPLDEPASAAVATTNLGANSASGNPLLPNNTVQVSVSGLSAGAFMVNVDFDTDDANNLDLAHIQQLVSMGLRNTSGNMALLMQQAIVAQTTASLGARVAQMVDPAAVAGVALPPPTAPAVECACSQPHA